MCVFSCEWVHNSVTLQRASFLCAPSQKTGWCPRSGCETVCPPVRSHTSPVVTGVHPRGPGKHISKWTPVITHTHTHTAVLQHWMDYSERRGAASFINNYFEIFKTPFTSKSNSVCSVCKLEKYTSESIQQRRNNNHLLCRLHLDGLMVLHLNTNLFTPLPSHLLILGNIGTFYSTNVI